MRRNTISALVLLVTAFMLSGCIVPFWVDGPSVGGGGRGGGHHDNGRHNGRR